MLRSAVLAAALTTADKVAVHAVAGTIPPSTHLSRDRGWERRGRMGGEKERGRLQGSYTYVPTPS